jgi:hypothetical protein
MKIVLTLLDFSLLMFGFEVTRPQQPAQWGMPINDISFVPSV